MQPLPNIASKIVNGVGTLLAPWNAFLQQFVTAPAPFIDLLPDVTSSPFGYIAVEPGHFIVSGGNDVNLFLTRGGMILDLEGQRIIPVGIKDFVQFSYTTIPTAVIFVPAFGAVQ